MVGKGRGLFMKLVDDQGAIIGLVVFMMIVLMGFVALAVDVGHLYMVRNELQNAADAGALAGASFLYSDNGTRVNAGANQIAFDAATSNNVTIFPGGWSSVQVDWTSGTNTGGIQRGHYNYATGEFTPNDALEPVDLLSGTEPTLNSDTNFVNAVRVITRTSTGSLFGRFLGISTSDLSAEAIAYIGFAKELNPRDVDQPIAICQDWLENNPCDHYRMVPDSDGQIARWITLDQDPLNDISCGEILDGNPSQASFDDAMSIDLINNNPYAFSAFRENWRSSSRCAMNDSDNDGIRDAPIDSNNNTIPDRPWILTLPVIDCTTGNPYSTPPLGRVVVEIIWITPPSEVCEDTPRRMYDEFSGINWLCPAYMSFCNDPVQRWDSFAHVFDFRDHNGQVLDNCEDTRLQNVMFIKPVCETVNGTLQPVRPLTGRTGSSIYPMNPTGVRGQLAKYPVLVK